MHAHNFLKAHIKILSFYPACDDEISIVYIKLLIRKGNFLNMFKFISKFLNDRWH